MNNGYVSRKFPLGSSEWVQCDCRVVAQDGAVLVTFRDDRSPVFRGALTARFEYMANLFKVELLMKGYVGTRRFFHEHPFWATEQRGLKTKLQEVLMQERDGQYCYSTWVPVSAQTLKLIEGETRQGYSS